LYTLGNRPGIVNALAGVASVAAQWEQFEFAAQLFGAVNELENVTAGAVLPTDAIEWQTIKDWVRQKIGAPNFEQAWTRGQAMSIEQAIADALALKT
jgi:hypothetical protein